MSDVKMQSALSQVQHKQWAFDKAVEIFKANPHYAQSLTQEPERACMDVADNILEWLRVLK